MILNITGKFMHWIHFSDFVIGFELEIYFELDFISTNKYEYFNAWFLDLIPKKIILT